MFASPPKRVSPPQIDLQSKTLAVTRGVLITLTYLLRCCVVRQFTVKLRSSSCKQVIKATMITLHYTSMMEKCSNLLIGPESKGNVIVPDSF